MLVFVCHFTAQGLYRGFPWWQPHTLQLSCIADCQCPSAGTCGPLSYSWPTLRSGEGPLVQEVSAERSTLPGAGGPGNENGVHGWQLPWSNQDGTNFQGAYWYVVRGENRFQTALWIFFWTEEHEKHLLLLNAFIFVSTGKFQEEPDQPAARFLRVSHTMDGDMTTSESVKFDWPRYVSLTSRNLICLFKGISQWR